MDLNHASKKNQQNLLMLEQPNEVYCHLNDSYKRLVDNDQKYLRLIN